jgi:E3 ubiquitin-protein ligase RFWD2
LTGHTNDKNFVGLTSCGDYVACGSEDNAVYVYYKGLSKPIILHKFKFSTERGRAAQKGLCCGPHAPTSISFYHPADTKSDTKDFVSSVAWRKNSDVILAANSVGIIHIMNIV